MKQVFISMRSNLIKLLFSLVLLTAVFYSVTAQTSSIISGKVLDTKNAPIHGVNIQITYIPWNRIINTVTNKKGIFSIANLPPGGPYLVKFFCDGYREYTREVSSLTLGDSNDLSLHMQQTSQEAEVGEVAGTPLVQNEIQKIRSTSL